MIASAKTANFGLIMNYHANPLNHQTMKTEKEKAILGLLVSSNPSANQFVYTRNEVELIAKTIASQSPAVYPSDGVIEERAREESGKHAEQFYAIKSAYIKGATETRYLMGQHEQEFAEWTGRNNWMFVEQDNLWTELNEAGSEAMYLSTSDLYNVYTEDKKKSKL